MPKNDNYDEEDDEDDIESPFDFFKMFNNPDKLFNSKQFRRLFKQIFEQIAKGGLPPEFQNLSPEDFKREFLKNRDKFKFKGPFMYGFNVGIGPDGNPTVDSFGNIKPKPYTGKPEVQKSRVPLVEVQELDDQLIVIAEMPGVLKEEIELKSTTNSLTISTKPDTQGRSISYYKEIDLPVAINSDYAKARYTNGILEIKLKKADDKHKNIQVD